MVVLAAVEEDTLKVPVSSYIAHINISTIKNSGEAVFEHMRAVVERMEPIFPLNFVNYLAEAAKDWHDAWVELLAGDRTSDRSMQYGRYEPVPARVVVDVDQRKEPVRLTQLVWHPNEARDASELVVQVLWCDVAQGFVKLSFLLIDQPAWADSNPHERAVNSAVTVGLVWLFN